MDDSVRDQRPAADKAGVDDVKPASTPKAASGASANTRSEECDSPNQEPVQIEEQGHDGLDEAASTGPFEPEGALEREGSAPAGCAHDNVDAGPVELTHSPAEPFSRDVDRAPDTQGSVPSVAAEVPEEQTEVTAEADAPTEPPSELAPHLASDNGALPINAVSEDLSASHESLKDEAAAPAPENAAVEDAAQPRPDEDVGDAPAERSEPGAQTEPGGAFQPHGAPAEGGDVSTGSDEAETLAVQWGQTEHSAEAEPSRGPVEAEADTVQHVSSSPEEPAAAGSVDPSPPEQVSAGPDHAVSPEDNEASPEPFEPEILEVAPAELEAPEPLHGEEGYAAPLPGEPIREPADVTPTPPEEPLEPPAEHDIWSGPERKLPPSPPYREAVEPLAAQAQLQSPAAAHDPINLATQSNVPTASVAAFGASPSVAVPTAHHPHQGKSRLRLAVRIGGSIAVALASFVFLLIVLYRWIDPPASTLMLGQRLLGTEINQRWVPIDRISPNLIRAVILSEDGAFCRHRGVDWAAMSEAIESARGGSTITMQVVKNLFLWPARSYVRKALEIWLAYVVELFWSKQRIMELYLNIAEWGPGVFGAEAAARTHFGKRASQLTSQEAALLTVSLPNPIERQAGHPGWQTRRLANNLLIRMRSSRAPVRCIRGG